MLCEMGDVAGAEQSILLLYRLDTSEGRGNYGEGGEYFFIIE